MMDEAPRTALEELLEILDRQAKTVPMVSNIAKQSAERIEALESDLSEATRDFARISKELMQSAETAERRIKVLEAALQEALEFVESQEDVRDGSDGKQLPNRAMQVAMTIRTALKGKTDD